MQSINYFENCPTIEAIKSRFRDLAKQHHPDLNGNTSESTAIMQEINNQYHAALNRGNGQISTDEHGNDHIYHYNHDTEQEIIDKILELVALELENCNIALIGTWIWILGDTKPRKEDLKKLGCKWHSKRGCWYWRSAKLKRWAKSDGDLASIAAKYGYRDMTKFTRHDEEKSKAKIAS